MKLCFKNRKINGFYIFLTIFFALYFLFITNFGEYVYGSTIDWNSQHYKLPEYFRQLFYETGDLFPDFAANLGSGQNIYNFSYYGLFNPVILLSYLLPFVSMRLYIQISTLLLVYISVVLLYKWLSSKFNTKVAAFAATLFMLSAPLLFHTHRHIMFVNYMPFLIMALMGVDKYFKAGKFELLTTSVFIICLTSYFYSVGSILVIVVYGVYVYASKNPKIHFKSFLVDGAKFVLPIILGIAMAAFLLIPTFVALLSGRADLEISTTIASLFLPEVSCSALLYSTYTLGLTSIALFALVFCIVDQKRAERLLSSILILPVLFPIISYLLSGGMYARGKALIPFLPLYIFVIAIFIDNMMKKSRLSLVSIGIFGGYFMVLLFTGKYSFFFLVDFMVTFISLILFAFLKSNQKHHIVKIAVLLVASLSFIICSLQDQLVPTKDINSEDSVDQLVNYATTHDTDFYRITIPNGNTDFANKVVSPKHNLSSVYSSLSNQNYQKFFYNLIGNDIVSNSRGQLTSPSNILYDLYIGNKYIVSNKTNRLGAEPITESNGMYLLKNKDALPIGYTSSSVMPLEQFETLEYPFKAEALLNYVIVENTEWCEHKTSIKAFELNGKITTQNNVTFEEKKDCITITADNNAEVVFKLDDELLGQLLFISFDVIDSDPTSTENAQININGISNMLSNDDWMYHNQNFSFEYTLSDTTIDQLDVVFSPGIYKISNIKAYIANYDDFVSLSNPVDPFIIDNTKTKGDIVEGVVYTEQEGYFNLSIPYDNGFTVYVDGEEVAYEKVDTAFVGFKLPAGKHHIKVLYNAPFSDISLVFSVLAWLVFGYFLYRQKSQPNKTQASFNTVIFQREEKE